MTKCEGCGELVAGRCKGVGRGGFCTDITEPRLQNHHPAVRAIENGESGMSCETKAFYEGPALEAARRNRDR